MEAPVALLECDFSSALSAFETWRLEGGADASTPSGMESIANSIRVVDANGLALECLRVSSTAEVERLLKDIWARDSGGLLRRMASAITGDGRVVEEDVVIGSADGRPRQLHLVARLPEDPAGLDRVIVVLFDVTKQQIQDEQRRQSQKLEAIGQLASGVAHDFNNLLTVILGDAVQIAGQVPGDPGLRRLAEEIREAASRASNLTRQLLAFGRQQVLEPRRVDLARILADSGRMLRRLIPEDIELVEERPDHPLPVRADPGALEQIIVNLVVNARDAIVDGGRIKLATSRIRFAEPGTTEGIPPGEYALLEVVDNGIGMTEEIRSRIFEPFFTTKPAGKGTGLGLSTVYGIVRQSSGHIRVHSEPGNGSVFKVYLPLLGKSEDQPAVPGTLFTEVAAGTETVLVAEDEFLVRGLVLRILRSQGYQPLEAPDGTNALELATHYPRPIHLLLTDVVMPGLSGIDLAARLKSVNPAIKILFMSGYSGGALMRQNVIDKGLPLIEKPFTPEDLLRKVREVLDER